METLMIRYLADGLPELRYIDGKSDWIDLYAAETVTLSAGESPSGKRSSAFGTRISKSASPIWFSKSRRRGDPEANTILPIAATSFPKALSYASYIPVEPKPPRLSPDKCATVSKRNGG